MREIIFGVLFLMSFKKIGIQPIGFVKRASPYEDEKDRSLISKIVLQKDLSKALNGIEDFSHIYIIFWMEKISNKKKSAFQAQDYMFPPKDKEPSVGVFATRAPLRPNPIGLTLVELIKREKNVLRVKGLDAYDGTPVLDIKPYPDWERGHWIVVENFRCPKWLMDIINSE
ncbi:MAG: tRNA (N6-threonylcarbamoyladenosine(37)-N6)-methyltransferase TrmO [Candidatus Heimdallarchaeota archaeon]